ncbi:MAG: lmo0937 family membrane protein [Bacteroidota bacterium]
MWLGSLRRRMSYRANSSRRRNLMIWTIIVILVILWLLGFFGRSISPRIPQTGGWIHILIIFAVILIVLNLLKII